MMRGTNHTALEKVGYVYKKILKKNLFLIVLILSVNGKINYTIISIIKDSCFFLIKKIMEKINE